MPLTLTVLRCPPAIAPETRTLTGGEFTVGRGPGVDWVLADVNQMVSRRHCTLTYRAGIWQVLDNSANGTFPNHDEEAIGKGNRRTLRDHDRLRIGPYEIEVNLTEDAAAGQAYTVAIPAGPDGEDPFGDPLWPGEAAQMEPRRPAHGGSLSNPFVDRTQDDHSSALDDAMQPPHAVGFTPMHTGGKIPADDLLPEGWDRDLPVAPPEPAQTLPPVRPARYENPISLAKPAEAASQGLMAPASDAVLLQAFLTGAGLPDARPADAVATMHRLGETYRALVSGLRAVLIARAAIKSEFRIEQTMIQTRGNNPLKFSANDDDAISALLGVGRHTDVEPARAVADALRDIRLHELASMAAMQSAVRTMVQALDPDKLRASVEQSSGRSLLSAQKKARAWEAYETLHARIAQAISDDFDSVFGKAFARAYEEAFDDLANENRPRDRS